MISVTYHNRWLSHFTQILMQNVTWYSFRHVLECRELNHSNTRNQDYQVTAQLLVVRAGWNKIKRGEATHKLLWSRVIKMCGVYSVLDCNGVEEMMLFDVEVYIISHQLPINFFPPVLYLILVKRERKLKYHCEQVSETSYICRQLCQRGNWYQRTGLNNGTAHLE